LGGGYNPKSSAFTWVPCEGTDAVSVGSGDGWKAWDMSALVPTSVITVTLAAKAGAVGFAARPTGAATSQTWPSARIIST